MSEPEEIYRDALTARLLRRMGHALQHDLKSPVQGIYWSLELALKGVSAEGVDEKARAQVEKAVAMARKELARLERTSRNFLADAGIVDDGEPRFDLAELARETVRHFVTDAAIRNVRLTVDTPPDAVSVRAPRVEIAQAVLTCVLHSLDSVPSGGCAEVFVRRENGRAILEVSDDAPAETGMCDGLGLGTLGMRVARQLVEARGGQMSSHPGSDGRRSTICVSLPLDAEA